MSIIRGVFLGVSFAVVFAAQVVGQSYWGLSGSTVYNSSGAAVGIGTSAAAGPLTVTDGSYYVNLQSANAGTGRRAVTLGYTGPYNGQNFGERSFLQTEYQGVGYSPFLVNPLGGAVQVGVFAPPGGADYGSDNGIRFEVKQSVTSSGAGVMSDFELDTAGTVGEASAGRFVTRQCADPLGGSAPSCSSASSSIRALEAQTLRGANAGSNGTFGIEVGLHSAVAGNQVDRNLGLYIHSDHSGWLSSGVRNDTGVLIEGADGWYNAILYRDTSGSSKFQVDQSGNVTGSSFATWSSRARKEAITDLSGDVATSAILATQPVLFRYKDNPGDQHAGFIAEDVPKIFSEDGKSVRVMEIVAALTATVKQQQNSIHDLREELDILNRR